MFDSPGSIITDGTNLYVADTSNHTIRKIVIATGVVATLAGTAGTPGSADGTGAAARFNSPAGITRDGTNLYVADTSNHTIRKIVIDTGVVTTIAGTAGTLGSANGTGAAARFNSPAGITSDGTNLYVADTSNHTIRKIVIATGVVTTLAGTAGTLGSADGTGAAARFNSPAGMTSDGTNLYVADTSNHTIRKVVIATGVVTTLAGTAGTLGTADGKGVAARFNYPKDITRVGLFLYVADTANHTIRRVVLATHSVTISAGTVVYASGDVTTIAGTAGTLGSADGTGAAARFNSPAGIISDGTNLYVADTSNHTIRKVVIDTGAVTTISLIAGIQGSADGTGTAATFNAPSSITTDGTNLYVTDDWNHTIRKIVIASGVVTTIAGVAGMQGSQDGIGAAALFNKPTGITTDGTNLYVADMYNHTIRKIVIASGAVTTIAGVAGTQGSADGTGATATLKYPVGITTDGTNLYVTDAGNNTIRQIVIASGAVTHIAGVSGIQGSQDGAGAAAQFNNPAGITTDGTNLYVTDVVNNNIRRIVIATSVVTTFVGIAGTQGSTDGDGASALFNYPSMITTDGINLYVADLGNRTIRKIVISSGVVTTIAGVAGIQGSQDGIAAAARFGDPGGITTDGTNLYVTDVSNNNIRKIQ